MKDLDQYISTPLNSPACLTQSFIHVHQVDKLPLFSFSRTQLFAGSIMSFYYFPDCPARTRSFIIIHNIYLYIYIYTHIQICMHVVLFLEWMNLQAFPGFSLHELICPSTEHISYLYYSNVKRRLCHKHMVGCVTGIRIFRNHSTLHIAMAFVFWIFLYQWDRKICTVKMTSKAWWTWFNNLNKSFSFLK